MVFAQLMAMAFGLVGQIIALAISIYMGFGGIQDGLGDIAANGANFGNVMTTASGVLQVASAGYAGYSAITAQNSAKNFQEAMSNIKADTKAEEDKRYGYDSNGVDLNKFNSYVAQDEDIDAYYYNAYGQIMYNDFYNNLAYNTPYMKYKEYDRFERIKE